MLTGDNRLIAVAVAGLAVALLFFGYAAREYMNSDCYAEMRSAGLDRETVEIFDGVGSILTTLRKGTGSSAVWDNQHFQDDVAAALEALASGRHGLKEKQGLTALAALPTLEEILSRMKRVATTRVNDILKKQDPSEPEAFEKYRQEGKLLVDIARRLDMALESLGERTRKLPGTCSW